MKRTPLSAGAAQKKKQEEKANPCGEPQDPRDHHQRVKSSIQLIDSYPETTVEGTELHVMSAKDIIRYSAVKIESAEHQKPCLGVNHINMGVSENGQICGTCFMEILQCPGHFGHIELEEPMYHPQFMIPIIQTLTCVCNSCSSLLVTDEYLKNNGLKRFRGLSRLKQIAAECEKMKTWGVDKKKIAVCPRVPGQNPDKTGPCKANPTLVKARAEDTQQVKIKTKSGGEDRESEYSVDEVLNILENISPQDAALLGFENGSHPMNFIIQAFPFLPPVDRPDNKVNGMVMANPLTLLYAKIADFNIKIGEYKRELDKLKGNAKIEPRNVKSKTDRKAPLRAATRTVTAPGGDTEVDIRNNLQQAILGLRLHITALIDNKDNNYAPGKSAFKSITDFLKGKEGIVRACIMGKRVEQTARTVLGSDPEAELGQTRIPKEIARELSHPVNISPLNIDKWQAILDDDATAGQILYVTLGDTTHIGKAAGSRIVASKFREANRLSLGDRIDRTLQNGDPIIFNRQPTLHRFSMMGHRAKISGTGQPGLATNYSPPYGYNTDQPYTKFEPLIPVSTLEDDMPAPPGRPEREKMTFGLHLCVTTPYNADFDGDEGVIHAVQSQGALYEVQTLMNVKACILSEQSNRPTYGMVYDSITGAFLLTHPDTYISPADMEDYLYLITLRDQLPSLKERLLKHGVSLTSGRALFSAVLPANFYFLNTKRMTVQNQVIDNTVEIVDGVLIRGMITSSDIGAAHNSIVQYLAKDYGQERTAKFLTDLCFVLNEWLTIYGLTVGPDDCLAGDKDLEAISNQEIDNIRNKVRSFGAPPKNPLEARQHESKIISTVGSASNTGDRVINAKLTLRHPLNAMIQSGSKGGIANITQIQLLCGQQFLRGARIEMRFDNHRRISPYFYPNDPSIEARGFVKSSFNNGLTPAEMYAHQYGTRENLIDTAVKTAETGYIQRKLIKALEDLTSSYLGSLTNAAEVIYQYVTHGHGFNLAYLQNVSTAQGNKPSFTNVRNDARRYGNMY